VQALSQGGQFLATRALAFGQNTLGWVTGLLIMLYLSFFFIRDGDRLLQALRQAVPLTPQHQAELSHKFSTVLRATVKGNVVVAIVQGTLGGLAFWVLDVQGTLLWAVLMAFLSLLPAIGAALVWGPVALYLLTAGQSLPALGLIAWGLLVVGLVDNLLRPLLVGKDTRLPDYVVLITTVGGMAVFGINGFVLGPLIAAMFFAVWQITVVNRSSVPREQGAQDGVEVRAADAGADAAGADPSAAARHALGNRSVDISDISDIRDISSISDVGPSSRPTQVTMLHDVPAGAQPGGMQRG